MSSWKKVKGLFWQPGDEGEPPPPAGADLSDAEFQEFLGQNPLAVPEGELSSGTGVSDASRLPVQLGDAGIDFQAHYDSVGIPDTDEVEQLENFLSRLDSSLPQASKLAAAQAFLGAIGKGKEHVLEDAARKIHCVRGILAGKQEETAAATAHEQEQVAALQAQIEQHRQRMEALAHELEGIRQACIGEESRLQAARVFFGSVG